MPLRIDHVRRVDRRRKCHAALVALALAGVAGCEPSAAGSNRPVIVAISGDMAGWIVPCGCTSNQSGGMPRRGTYIAQLRGGAEVVLADVGGAPGGTRPYDKERFEAILAGERAMQIAAHNVGAAEARLGAAYLRDAMQRLGVPLVSANLRDEQGQEIAPAFRIVEAGGRRIALIGVLSEQFVISGLTVLPPRRAALEAIEKLPSRCDAVIVLAYAPESELNSLAADLPEVDAVVGGPTSQAIRPRPAGRVMLAAATNKGKFLVQLQMPDASGSAGWTGKVVELDQHFADQPAQRQIVDQFYQQLKEKDFAPADTSFVSSVPSTLPADYRVAGNKACAECHRAESGVWAATPHAHAWKTLETSGAQVDSFCQQCHTTAYGMPGGFQSPRRTPALADVGCEACHGPSQAHASDPNKPTPYARTVAGRCTSCHDVENSPHFAYETYWPKIRHGTAEAKEVNPHNAADPAATNTAAPVRPTGAKEN